MSYYQNASKIMYRRYRIVRKTIWTFNYINSASFSSDIILLMASVHYHMRSLYAGYSCLLDLNNYYYKMCINEMHERVDLEKCIADMHKRFKLGVNVKEIL